MARLGIDAFTNFFRYYKGLPHQQLAVAELWKQMPPALLEDDAEWVEIWRDPAVEEEEVQVVAPYQIITPELMERLTGYAADEFDQQFCEDCNRLIADTGFDAHIDALQMLMANFMHETCNFVYMQEIADGWAYEGRRDLGNVESGDGPRFKGAGVLQLTGRYNYSRLAKGIGDQRVMEGVDYVSNTYPFTSARVWIEENNLLDVCLYEGFDACCKKINGGWRGYADRLEKYQICQRELR